MIKVIHTGLGLIVLAMVLMQFSACKHDPFMPDEVTPIDTTNNPIDTIMGTPCDPDIIYFNLEIQPILTSNCAFSGCHDVASAEDGVILTDYQRVIQTADVRAFDLDGSELYEVITDSDPEDRMPPQPQSALTSAQINLIATWILQGAENLECDPDAGGCDVTDVSYSMTIVPILQNACIGCHSGAAPAGGIVLSTHAGVQTVALNGSLVGTVSYDPGYSPMPQGGTQLSDCKIDQIRAWAADGAQNN
jgi:mono/diheme cytochrome c family protein